ncbi:MAG: Stk1 family PASTA domain-containing Ser/Thr kinase [Actinomycetota bacterium]
MATTRILNGRYEIDAPVGTGGMATVFRGTDTVLGRTVAVKLLADRFVRDEQFVTRFRREAQAAAGLNHPNVVSVYDTGDDGDAHYIVMEYVEGRTLADVLRDEGAVSPIQAVAIVDQVTRALEAAHEQGLVHRDVKPGNILLTDGGAVKVTDFGIARAATDETLTQTGIILGTASYLSPEQARGQAVDARSDIYSLGCVLFEMLTGQVPFTGDSAMAVAYQHVNENPEPPSRMRDDVPAELDEIVMTAMAKDPGHRYPTAGEFRKALLTTAGTDPMVLGTAEARDTEPLPRPGHDTEVMPPATDELRPPERRTPAPRWLLPVLGMVGALAVAGILILSLGDPERAATDPPATDGPSAIPSVTSVGGLTLDQTILLLDRSLSDGLEAGEITQEVADDIAHRASDALGKQEQADVQGAGDTLDEAMAKVDEAVTNGDITSIDRGLAIKQALATMKAAIVAAAPAPSPTPSPDDDEPEDDEEGGPPDTPPGQGKEKGKGKDKGDDD